MRRERGREGGKQVGKRGEERGKEKGLVFLTIVNAIELRIIG